jgi:hypothetical protein
MNIRSLSVILFLQMHAIANNSTIDNNNKMACEKMIQEANTILKRYVDSPNENIITTISQKMGVWSHNCNLLRTENPESTSVKEFNLLIQKFARIQQIRMLNQLDATHANI